MNTAYFCRIVRRDETDPTGLGTLESWTEVTRRTKIHWDAVMAPSSHTLEIWLSRGDADDVDTVLLWKRP